VVTSKRSKRPPPGATIPDLTTARNGPASNSGSAEDTDPTVTDRCAGVSDGVDGATHKTAAQMAATATPATSRRRHAAASNIV
jgi:hypothetical protein